MAILSGIIHRFSDEIRRFVRFGLVGVANTGIDFGVFVILTRLYDVYYLKANAFSWLVAVCSSFLLNKYWTFRSYNHQAIVRQYVRFFIVSSVALGMSMGLLYIFVEWWGVKDAIAKLMTIGIVLFWNFFLHKFWTFKHN